MATRTKGKRFKLSVFDTFKLVFKANHFAMNRMPLMIPRTDAELAKFLQWELNDASLNSSRLKQYRANFNAGRMTKGVAPAFNSIQFIPQKEQTNEDQEILCEQETQHQGIEEEQGSNGQR